MPTHLHCIDCRRGFEVSEEDPDSTLDDFRYHVQRLHPGEAWHPLIGEGRP